MSDVPHVRTSKEEERLELEEKSVAATEAMRLFREGYNCSQSVFCAFAPSLGLDKRTAAKIASSFGGGMGRMREVCGAVTGMFMVAGLARGYSDSAATLEKTEHYALVQRLAARFKDLNGSIVCRSLLGLPGNGADDPKPESRTAAYYQKRPCEILVGQAAFILEQELSFRTDKD